MSRSSIPTALREEVFLLDRGRCAWCHLAQLGHGATFHVDHIWPRSRGGATTIENLALQCPSCSLHKSNRVAGIDPLSGQECALFHPRRETWTSHFRIDRDGTCEGLTPTGRATIMALAMNDPLPRFARACQLALGLLRIE